MKPWLLCLIVLTPLLASGCSSCSKQVSREVPEELLGVWKTSHYRYADRFLEFRAEEVIFGTGGETSTTFPLLRFSSTESDTGTVYMIYYENERGEESSMRMLYSGEGGGSLKDLNQTDVVWMRER